MPRQAQLVVLGGLGAKAGTAGCPRRPGCQAQLFALGRSGRPAMQPCGLLISTGERIGLRPGQQVNMCALQKRAGEAGRWAGGWAGGLPAADMEAVAPRLRCTELHRAVSSFPGVRAGLVKRST